MATDLTSVAIKDGFSQLLHCDGGLSSTETAVLDGDGTSSTLSLGTTSATIAGNLVISGNLTISGTTTSVNTQTLNVADNIVVLNNDVTGTPSQNAGIEIERGTSTNTLMRWNESTDRWQFTNDGSTYYNIPITSELGSSTFRTVTAGGNTLGASETLAFTAGSNVTITENAGAVTIAATNTNTFRTVTAGGNTLDVDETLAFTAGSNIAISESNGAVTIAATDTNTFRTITAGGNTLGSSETLAFVAGSNVTITESGGAVTIASSTDLNSLSAGAINTSNDSFGFIDADDSNASKKESIADFLTAIAGSGISAGSGQLSRDSIALGGLSNVSSSSPSSGDFLKWGGSQWEPTAVSVMTGWKLRDSSSASNDKTVSEGKFVKIVAANSGSYGDVAFSGSTGATDDPFVVSISAPNTTYSAMGSGNSYAAGLVLAGASNHLNQYLRKDGTWTLPSIHVQDDDGDSITVDIDEHIKITGTGGISTDWTTDDAGGAGNAPNILTIGLGNITQVGALSQGSIATGFQTIDEGFIDSDIVRKNANTTITGIYTFSGKGIAINAGNSDNGSGQDASFYVSATSNNDWGIWVNKASNEYGVKISVASDSSLGLAVYGGTTKKFSVTGNGVIDQGTWNGSVIASAYLDSDTAHLSGTQTFSGAKTFSSTTTFSNTSSYGDLDIIPTSSNVSIIKHDNGSGSLTLRGDQIRLQNKDGDDTGLTYNDGAGITFGGNVTHGGNIQTATSTDYAVLHGITGGLRVLSSRSGDAGILWTNNSGAFRGQLYGDGTNYGFLTGHWASWDIKKVINGQLSIRVGGSDYTVWHAGNDGSGSGLDADTLDSYQGSNYIGKNGNSYYRPDTWIDFASSDGAGLYWSSNNGSGWHLYPVNSNDFYIRSGNSAQVGLAMSTAGATRGYFYANSSNQIGLLDENGSWALKKISGGSMILYDDGGTTTLGSGDEWGRLQSENYSNGFYFYSDSYYRVDGADFCTYTDGEHNLGANQTTYRWKNLYLSNQIVGGFGAMTTGGTANWNDSTNARSGAGYTLLLGNHSNGPSGTSDYFHPHSYEYSSKDGGGNMCQFAIPYIVGNGGGMYMRSRYSGSWSGWIQFHDNNNMTGIDRTGNTYGSFNVTAGNNAWAGITYSTHSSKPTIMFKDNHGEGGLYYQTSGDWRLYYSVSNTCMGINNSTTSSSYGAYVTGGIYSTGDVVAFSDARVKTNVVTIDNPLDKVLNMRGVYYNPINKETKEIDDRRRVGVIAQELNEVLPEAVTYAEDVDEYGVDYGKLTGILIEAIKELKQEINELKGS